VQQGMNANLLTLDPGELPAATGSKLYSDYLTGVEKACAFYSWRPLDFEGALARRKAYDYPRPSVARQLAEYNARLGAGERARANIDALGEPDTLCVITGQQAGFMGGPAYTAYKIITAIRLAEHLTARWGLRVVPVFWVASEDHDFGEINHTYLIRRDGEVGRVRFGWREQGRPVSDLQVGGQVRRACDEYWRLAAEGPYTAQSHEAFSCRPGEGFSQWQARVWSQLFASRGLVVVEPHVIRPVVPEFFVSALQRTAQIEERLLDVTRRLEEAGYAAAITSQDAGLLYTFDADGLRVRVRDPESHVERAAAEPVRYSTDAALRPLLADAVLPVIASVLGPGETVYQGMLKPLYELYELPQPVLYPRHSYTIVSQHEAERLAEYKVDVKSVLMETLEASQVLLQLVPEVQRRLFASAQSDLEAALSPLLSHVRAIDPSLARTWEQTLLLATGNLAKLEQRAARAQMARSGFSKLELRRIKNALLPRGRLQERVLPFAHFYSRHGPALVDRLYSAGELGDLRHHILELES
jgi:bacillithiol biosynthesis cysteine-adding enzyme BshC